MRKINNLSSVYETGTQEVKPFRAGRMCKHPTCNQELSIYNPNKYCFVHALDGARIEDKKKVQKNCWEAKKARYKMKGKIIDEKTSDVMGECRKKYRNGRRKPEVSFLVGTGSEEEKKGK